MLSRLNLRPAFRAGVPLLLLLLLPAAATVNVLSTTSRPGLKRTPAGTGIRLCRAAGVCAAVLRAQEESRMKEMSLSAFIRTSTFKGRAPVGRASAKRRALRREPQVTFLGRENCVRTSVHND